MIHSSNAPVLVIGGSGLVGSRAARTLRRITPNLPIVIGGRDRAKASIVAREIGNADATTVDLEREDLGLPPNVAYGAVAVFVKDDSLNSARFAQARGIPYVSISTGAFELGPEVAQFIHRPTRSAMVMASQWLAGAASIPTRRFAEEFRTIDSIAIGAVLDERDIGGPAAYVDYERLTTATSSALVLQDGKWRWLNAKEGARTFVNVDGTETQGHAYSAFDALSLATATNARSVRFDLAVGESSGRRAGGPFSTDIVIELTGERKDGGRARVRHEIGHPEGQAPVTAVGVAVIVERALGLVGGPAVQPGLYFADSLVEPGYFMKRLEEFGATIRRA